MFVGNLKHRAEGQGRVRCGQIGGVEGFPRGCGPSVKFGAVPGGYPFLPEGPSGNLGRLCGAQGRECEGTYTKQDYSFHILYIGTEKRPCEPEVS
jgi:hypothetical protein